MKTEGRGQQRVQSVERSRTLDVILQAVRRRERTPGLERGEDEVKLLFGLVEGEVGVLW